MPDLPRSAARRRGNLRLILAAAFSALAACSSNGPTGPGAGSLKLYVADATNNEVWVFPATAAHDVDAVPLASIQGSHTGLNVPEGVAVDATGKVYVSNFNGNTITVYAAGASGDDAPIATLAGPSTVLQRPEGLAFDGAGRLYVVNDIGPGAGTVTVYAAGPTGNAAPITTIGGPSTGLDNPWGVAVDATGRIYVSNPGATSILIYAAGAAGDVAPVATIAGPSTGLNKPLGIVLDAPGQQHGGQHLYVGNFGGDNITVYSGAATGDAAPFATIGGLNTELHQPGAVALDGGGQLYAGNNANTAVTVYPVGANGAVPATFTLFLHLAGVKDIQAIALGP